MIATLDSSVNQIERSDHDRCFVFIWKNLIHLAIDKSKGIPEMGVSASMV